MYSSVRMKNRGDTMSSCNTLGMMENISVLIFLTSPCTVVNADVEVYTARVIAIILVDAPDLSKAWSRNLWLTESNAAV